MNLRLFLFLLAGLVATGVAHAQTQTETEDPLAKEIRNYVRPTDGDVAYAGQPTADGFQAVKDAGFKTVINLRPVDEMSFDEKKVVEDLGMTYVNIPITTFSITDEKISQLADLLGDPDMHGVDWKATLEKYLPLVERVTTRAELSDLIGDVVGELSALHTSVRGGDHRKGPDEIKVASLGARVARDETVGGYRIDHIYRSDPDYPELLSPLADTDLAIEEGDVIKAVNGVEALDAAQIGVRLRNQHGKQVLLRVNSARTGDSREIVVIPTDDEYNLRYRDWEYGRQLQVEQGSEGKLGYVHLRAMGSRYLSAWYRQFYPVHLEGKSRRAVLEHALRLSRPHGRSYRRVNRFRRGGVRRRIPATGFGPAHRYPNVGRRGLAEPVNRLSDGGIARAPMLGVYGPEGDWLIEGHGVDPDIVIDNLPHQTFEGGDAQLDAAIDYLLEKIREDPKAGAVAPHTCGDHH